MAKRDSRILSILTSRQRVEVSELSELLGVSEVTVRKDLDALQERGLVIRQHGFATLSNLNDVGGRLAYHYDEKRRIAHEAAKLVRDDSTIMVESGSCCALLVRELADTKKGLTIVTNSAFIAGYVRDSANVSCTLLGGTYQRDSQVTVGPLLRACAREFYVERLFIGADGWVQGVGPTNADQMRGDAACAMAESAEQVVVLTESEKFGRRGAIPMRLSGKRMSLITDESIPGKWKEALTCDGVDVCVAS